MNNVVNLNDYRPPVDDDDGLGGFGMLVGALMGAVLWAIILYSCHAIFF